MDHDQARRELERTCGFVSIAGRMAVRRVDLIELVEEVQREVAGGPGPGVWAAGRPAEGPDGRRGA